jgi:hypothetical protein
MVTLDPLTILKQQVALMEQQQKQLEQQSNRLSIVEAKLETSQMDYFSIAGYASLRGLKVDISTASILGRKASKLSKESDFTIGTVNDPRFGTINTYHLDILKIVFGK